ncbi:MAG: CRISPR-associated exonuclease Cas4 [Succiniclasticum sp.]|jgi:CRISPR-associated exonuclease Cas4
MGYEEDEFRMISELQHFSFCRRQWGLIHLEQEWSDNYLTADGNILHKRAHEKWLKEKRSGVLVARGLRVFSREMGVTGVCDVVEFSQSDDPTDGAILFNRPGTWNVYPIEYKRGKPKSEECDRLQLCCEAMCLEEMLNCVIPEGALYYFEIRHRIPVPLDSSLRQRVKELLKEIHEYADRKFIPVAKVKKQCKSCSLKDICLPKLQAPSVKEYYAERLKD